MLLFPQIAFQFFQTSNFLLSGLHKMLFRIFENLSFQFFTNFVLFSLTWDPNGNKNVKMILLPLIAFDLVFQICCESCQWSSQLLVKFLLSGTHKGTVLDFEICTLQFKDLFTFSLTWNHVGMNISKSNPSNR